jgi:hypothetical protein
MRRTQTPLTRRGSLLIALLAAAIPLSHARPAHASGDLCSRANWASLEESIRKLAGYSGRIRFDKDEVVVVWKGENLVRCGAYASLPLANKQTTCLSSLIDRSKTLPVAQSGLSTDPAYQDGAAALIALDAQGFKLEIDKPYITFTVTKAGVTQVDDVAEVAISQPEVTGVSATALGRYLKQLAALSPCRLNDLSDTKLAAAIRTIHRVQ